MDLALERDSSILGSLFQQIISDMKNTAPLWEDFVSKAGKLHACLKAAIQAIAAYLDAFQKIADAATNSKGASKEIGTALTRVCLRHKAVEMRLKTFTATVMDCLVQRLQDKIEDWKRSVAVIDKEHAKEYKRCRTELKKRSNDTLRLQKKARKGQADTLQMLVDSHMQDVTLRRAELEEVEKKALRSVMIEERMRYCTFVHILQPVVKEECEVLSELGHLQEVMDSISLVTKDPNVLPQASEELIHEAKLALPLYPESPCNISVMQLGSCSNSLGSRKSSMCSISSTNSSGSGNSPGHHHYQRSLSQFVAPIIRLKPGESSDSGFCSSSALTNMKTPVATSNPNSAASTWPPHSQDDVDSLVSPSADRPHTISTAYEKGHQRPPLTVYTFQNPDEMNEYSTAEPQPSMPVAEKPTAASNVTSRPPLPVRCSSLERPLPTNNQGRGNATVNNLLPRQCPSPIPARITKELSTQHQQQHQLTQQPHQHLQQPPQSQPTYVNMSDLAAMAATKATNQQKTTAAVALHPQLSVDSISSQRSNESSTSAVSQQSPQSNMEQKIHTSNDAQIAQTANSTRSHSLCSSGSSNTTFGSADTGHIPTPSSGSSTPQNNYSPLLTNSPTSTPSVTSTGSNFAGNEEAISPPDTDESYVTAGNAVSSNSGNNTPPTICPPQTMPKSSEGLPLLSTADPPIESPTVLESEDCSRASVLQKASMFEKQAAAASKLSSVPNSARTPQNIESGSVSRRSDERRSPATGLLTLDQQEVGKSFEDSILELNNLIGELDSFQREIDSSKSEGSSDNNCDTTSASSSAQHLPLCSTPEKRFDETLNSTLEKNVYEDIGQRLGGDYESAGYENPSFLHVSTNSSTKLDESTDTETSPPAAPQKSDDLHYGSDCGSAVVVIYDHQIPMTPDIDYVKQNSEIVILRTNDSSARHNTSHASYELRELPVNLSSCSLNVIETTMTTRTATVTSPKQRLSSFCASASSDPEYEQLGTPEPSRGYNSNRSNSSGCCSPGIEYADNTTGYCGNASYGQLLDERITDTIVRRRLPPKPGVMIAKSEQISEKRHPALPRKPPATTSCQTDLRNILNARITQQQGEKLLRNEEARQEQQQQYQNIHKTCSTETLPLSLSSTTSSPSSPSTQSLHISPSLSAKCVTPPISPINTHTHQQQHHQNREMLENCYSHSNVGNWTTPPVVSVAQATVVMSGTKPSISPRPASLSGGPSRIARRSSVNAARPPPPVRRSSSVTPNPNSSTSLPNGAHVSSNIVHHDSNQDCLMQSIESLPPPPPYLLHDGPTSTAFETGRILADIHQQPAAVPQQHRSYANQDQPHSMYSYAYQTSQVLPPTPPRPIHFPSAKANPSSGYRQLQQQQHQQQVPQQAALKQLFQQCDQQQQRQQQQHPYQHQQQTKLPICITNSNSSRSTTPGIYAQPKTANMSSFRTASPGPNGYGCSNQSPPTHPKTNPNLIAQLNARLSSKQQQQHQNSMDGPIYDNAVQASQRTNIESCAPRESRIYGQHQQHPQHSTDGKLEKQSHHKVYGSVSTSLLTTSSTNASPTYSTTTNFNTSPHFPLSSSTSSMLSKLGSFSSAHPNGNTGHNVQTHFTTSHYYAAHVKADQTSTGAITTATATNSKDSVNSRLVNITAPAQATPTAQTRQSYQQYYQQQQREQQHYACPQQPMKDGQSSLAHTTTATILPKNISALRASAAAAGGNAAANAKNALSQNQRYQQPAQHAYQHSARNAAVSKEQGSANYRSPMPHAMPQQQQQQKQKHQQHVQSLHRPTSAVQQKIFVSTNPFIQTTSVKCHSPSSMHATPTASPTSANSPSFANIYGTAGRSASYYHHHQQQLQLQQAQQQQQQQKHGNAHGGGGGGGGEVANNKSHTIAGHYNTNHAEKTGSIRAKSKAEFLENLNAKLAKQGMSGRAFAVRNLINSKALPDPRVCHESLMDQIKRGATLKRNQKINDRSAPKIY